MRALILVDMILAFFRNGGLAVPNAEEILDKVNDLLENGDENGAFDLIVASYEEHRKGNLYLAKTHDLKENTMLEVDGETAMRWVDHAMQGTDQINFHPDLKVEFINALFRKGYALDEHPFSAFGGFLMKNGHQMLTTLFEYLKSKGVTEVVIVGLAYDYCAGETALDAANFGFKVSIIKSATRSIAPSSEAEMDEKLRAAGVEILEAA